MPCAEWMCGYGHETDPAAGNCLIGGTEWRKDGEGTSSSELVLERPEDAGGIEFGEGSYSFDSFGFAPENDEGGYSFRFTPVAGSPGGLNRCSDLTCCASELLFESQVVLHSHTR